MLKKIEYVKTFINNSNILYCPFCKSELFLDNSTLKCKNNHNYDIKKNGSLFLINTNKYTKSDFYTKELFEYRRNFIQHEYYGDIYNYIRKILNRKLHNNSYVLDLGCGESTHLFKIYSNHRNNFKWIGLDYSKDAIDLSTDYLNGNNIFIVGDVNNIPLKDKSIDCIIDFLSPFNTEDTMRVLKDDGIFIKIIPDELYLIELRNLFHIPYYNPNSYINKKLTIIEQKIITNKYKIKDISDKKYLANYTPLTWNKNHDYNIINDITISLNVIIFKKES